MLKYPSNVAIVPGMSGGPVVDGHNKLVAVNIGGMKDYPTYTVLQPIVHGNGLIGMAGINCIANEQGSPAAPAQKDWEVPLTAEQAYQQAVERAQASQDSEAVKLYRLAAEQGHVIAMHNLAVRLYLGKGTHADGKEALRWYRLAAERGYGESMFVLASRYAKGVDVAQDVAEAARWMVMALKHRNQDALNEMTAKFNSWNLKFRVAFQNELSRQTAYSGPTNGDQNMEMQQTVRSLMNR